MLFFSQAEAVSQYQQPEHSDRSEVMSPEEDAALNTRRESRVVCVSVMSETLGLGAEQQQM